MYRGMVVTIVASFVVLAAASGWWTLSARADLERRERAIGLTAGNPDRAPRLLVANGCAGCHQIPGVPMANGRVGPSLSNIRGQAYLGGVLTNTPENLERWITSARDIDPKTAMPSIPLEAQDARDIAAYLYALP